MCEGHTAWCLRWRQHFNQVYTSVCNLINGNFIYEDYAAGLKTISVENSINTLYGISIFLRGGVPIVRFMTYFEYLKLKLFTLHYITTSYLLLRSIR